MRTAEGTAAKDDGADGAGGLGIGNGHVTAVRAFFDGHGGNDGDAHARADHAEKAAELAALEDDLGLEPRAVASGYGRVAKTMAVAEQEERLGAEIFQGERAAGGQAVLFGQGGEETLGEKRKRLELVATDRKGEDGDVDGRGAQAFEKDRGNILDDVEPNLGKLAREGSEMRRKKIRRDGRDDADAYGAAERVFLLEDVAACGFELAKNGAGMGKKGLAKIGEANRAAGAVEQADAKFVFELQDLLGERGLGNVGLLGGPAEGAGFGDGAEVAKLMEFHVSAKNRPIGNAYPSYPKYILDV